MTMAEMICWGVLRQKLAAGLTKPLSLPVWVMYYWFPMMEHYLAPHLHI